MLLMDADGVPYDGFEALDAIYAAANAPIFGYYRSHLGRGAVGGRLYQETQVGVEAARVAIRILRGERAGDIPPVILGASPPTYDWRELTRWGISLHRLPAGSVIEFRQPTFWAQYRWWVVGVVVFCGLQTALIAGLLFNRARRREDQAMATLISELSSRFINLPADQVDPEIEAAQRRVCDALGLDVSSLWQWRPDNPVMHTLTHYYRPLGGPPVPDTMKGQDYFPWCQRRVLAGEVVMISSMADLPAEAARDRETFNHYGLKTTLTIPLTVGGGLVFGSVNFNDMRRERRWSQALVQRLQLVAQIFANALARKVADQTLHESETRYRSIFDEAIEGMFRTSVEGRLLAANGALARILRYDSAEEAMRVIENVGQQAWADPDKRQQFVQRLAEEGSLRAFECQLKRKDGTKIWVSLNARAVRGPDGQVAYVDGFIEDISERRRVADALERSEERFRALAETALVGIYILQDGHYTYVNPAMARIFGYSVEEMLGMLPRQIVQPDDHSMVGEHIRRRLEGEVRAVQYEVRGRYRDGSTRNVEVYGVGLKIDGKAALVGTLIDITDRKRKELALERMRWLHAETEKLGKVGGWEFDIDTRKQTWTEETRNIHEVDASHQPTVEEGINFFTLASRPIMRQAVQRAIEHGEPYDLELEINTAKGNLRKVHAIGKPDLEHRRVYGFIQDITDRKQAELALAETELRYRLLFEAIPESVLLIGTDGRVVAANPASARLYRYESAKELEGFYTPLLIAEKDRARAIQTQATVIQGSEQ